MRFSVVVVNYNGGGHLQGAIDSLAGQTFTDFEVLVWDNNSTDGSIDRLDVSGLKKFQVIRCRDNLGFAAANNRAAEQAEGQWLALLNPDAAAAPDWLERMDAAICRDPECRMFASAQFSLGNPGQLDGAGDNYLVFGFPWRGGFGLQASELPGRGECFSPCGAGAVIEMAAFRKLEGLDERLFCYCEDVDFGFRMRLQGDYCIFLPDAVIFHDGGSLSGKLHGFALYHGTRNRLWVYFARMPAALLLLTLPGHIAITLYLAAREGRSERGRLTRQALGDAIAGAWAHRNGQKWASPKRTVSLAELTRAMVWNPWRMSRQQVNVVPDRRNTH